MNTTNKQYAKILWLAVILIITFTACKDDDDFQYDTDDNTPQTESTSTTTEVNNALIFNSAQFKSGTVPANSNLGDLKINKDTINIWPGIQNRISILNHTNITISGVLVHIPEADGYHEVDIEIEESNDTLTVFYVDIDPDGLDLPYENYITISPTDGSGNIIDEFPHTIHIDTPFNGDTGAGPDGTEQGICPSATGRDLNWLYTEYVNPDGSTDIVDYPSLKAEYANNSEVEGCCYNGDGTSGCAGRPTNASISVYDDYSTTVSQSLYFFEVPLGNSSRNEYSYNIKKDFNDYDPDKSDFCAGTAGYSFRSSGLFTGGEYSITPNRYNTVYDVTIHTRDIPTQEIIDAGYSPEIVVNENQPNFKYTMGCRYFIMTIDYGEGSIQRRCYEDVKSILNDIWYD